jgi:hypothetical protein
MLRLIPLSLENLGRICNLAVILLFIKELPSFGVEDVQKISSLFFLSYQTVDLIFTVSNCISCFVPLSNNQMKTKMNVATVIMKLMFRASNGV